MNTLKVVPFHEQKPPYKASTNADSLPYVDGPGPMFSYDSGTLFHQYLCDSYEEAKRAALIANAAYMEGYERAQYNMRAMLGVKD